MKQPKSRAATKIKVYIKGNHIKTPVLNLRIVRIYVPLRFYLNESEFL
jgi:hypothetical protein